MIQKDSRWLCGAGLLVLFSLFQSLGSLVLRECSLAVPFLQLLCLQAGGALVFLSPWLLKDGWRGLKTEHLGMQVVRGWSVLFALSCLIISLSQIALGHAVLLSNLAPIFVPLLVWVWNGHRPHASIWVSAGIGFAGVFLVLQPQNGHVNWGWMIGVLGGLLIALSYVQVEVLSKWEPARRIIFYTLSTIFLSCLPLVLWDWVPMTGYCWGMAIAAGFALACTSVTLISGLMMGPPEELSPFTYFSVIFAYVWGVLLYQENLQVWQMVGIALVIAAGVLALRFRGSSNTSR